MADSFLSANNFKVYVLIAITFVIMFMCVLISERKLMKTGPVKWNDIPVDIFETRNSTLVSSRTIDTVKETGTNIEQIETTMDKEIQTVYDSKLIYKSTKEIHDNVYSTPMNKTCARQFPTCIVVGVYKCGTRELMDFISMHPNVAIKTNPYEFAYFQNHYFQEDNRSYDYFRRNMPCIYNDQITMMKHPGYFADTRVPERLFKFNRNLKMILMVREPVQRFFSHVWFGHPNFSFKDLNRYIEEKLRLDIKPGNPRIEKNKNKIRRSVNQEAITSLKQLPRNFDSKMRRLLQYSVYDEPYERYMKYFKQEQILLIDSEEFKADPMAVLYKVESFLNLPHRIQDDNFVYIPEKKYYCIKSMKGTGVCYDKRRGHDYREDISNATKQKLKDYFRPHNDRFFSLIGKYFNWND